MIKDVLNELLSSRAPGEPGGFVIFHGPTDYDYVQYSLDEGGLLLNWPTYQEGGAERLPLFVEILIRQQFIDRSPSSSADADRHLILSLDVGEMCIADDGLYAQCGRDAEKVAELTTVLLQQVFKVYDCRQVGYTLEIDG